jgi:hypothetical protein
MSKKIRSSLFFSALLVAATSCRPRTTGRKSDEKTRTEKNSSSVAQNAASGEPRGARGGKEGGKKPENLCQRLFSRNRECTKVFQTRYSERELGHWADPKFVGMCKKHWLKKSGALARTFRRKMAKCVSKRTCARYAVCCDETLSWKTEAPANLKRMIDGALSAYFEKHPEKHKPTKKKARQAFSSAPLTPSKSCCKQKKGKCRKADWSKPAWQAIGFETYGDHTFRYAFLWCATKRGSVLLVARAINQPYCDGRYLVVERRCRIKSGQHEHEGIKSYWAVKLPKHELLCCE